MKTWDHNSLDKFTATILRGFISNIKMLDDFLM